MHPSILHVFSSGLLTREEVAGKAVLEVGSADVNGSVRPIIEALGPASYLGVDAALGPRVDRVVDCTELADVLGADAFDVVISTEMLEHVRDWKACVGNLVAVTRPGGLLVLTTRSPGFPYHPYPEDHWRYPVPVMREILARAGCEVLVCEPDPDPASPGVIAKARKPLDMYGYPGDDARDDVLAGIEAVAVLQPGAGDAGRPLTILGCPHNADGSGYYRMYLPYEHLARNTSHRMLLPQSGSKFYPDDDQLAEIDVIAGQRFCGPGEQLWEKWSGRAKLVYEVDDDVLRPDTWSGLAHMFDPVIHESFKRCIRMSDLVTVSTEPLAEQMRRHNPNVAVLPNHIDADLLYMDRPRRERVTAGWSGGMSHLADWVGAADPVREVLERHPGVDMHFCGIDYSPVLKLSRPTRYTAWRPDVWSFFKSIDFDIGLAPLADTPFNTCKSHIRALEYMALGIPVIASDVPAYRGMVVDGVTGYLVRTPEEWVKRLTELINDADARAEMGAAGREAAAAWTVQRGWKLWRDAYEEVAGWSS